MNFVFLVPYVVLLLGGNFVADGQENARNGQEGTAKRLNIILTNDDGFETTLIQATFTTLKNFGHNIIMSAPYDGQSGTSARVDFLQPVLPTSEPSPHGTIPTGSPGVGPTTLGDGQFYVASAATSAVLYGVDVLAPRYFGGPPDLVLSGPNEGNNVGLLNIHSGTMGATLTSMNKQIPAISLSANHEEEHPELVAQLVLHLVNSLTKREDDRFVVPPGMGLNVNFPTMEDGTSVMDYTFVPAKLGVAASVGLVFVENLERDCPFAGAFGAALPLPGMCLSVPYHEGGYPLDDDEKSEHNVIMNGKRQIAVSVIQNNYFASDDVVSEVHGSLQSLFTPPGSFVSH